MKNFLLICLLLLLACKSSDQPDGENKSVTDEPEKSVNVAPESVDESEIAETTIPMDFGLRKVGEEELRAFLYDGDLVNCWSWDDKNGTNYLIRAIESPELEYPLDDGTEFYRQNLNVYHYYQKLDSEPVLLRDLTDFVKECDFDIVLYHLEPVVLTDLDEDNIGEITFGYRTACTSDVSPSTQKVVLFENGDKYILRGETLVLGYGGEFEPGNELNEAPAGFQVEMEKYWEANKKEYDFEENEF